MAQSETNHVLWVILALLVCVSLFGVTRPAFADTLNSSFSKVSDLEKTASFTSSDSIGDISDDTVLDGGTMGVASSASLITLNSSTGNDLAGKQVLSTIDPLVGIYNTDGTVPSAASLSDSQTYVVMFETASGLTESDGNGQCQVLVVVKHMTLAEIEAVFTDNPTLHTYEDNVDEDLDDLISNEEFQTSRYGDSPVSNGLTYTSSMSASYLQDVVLANSGVNAASWMQVYQDQN